VNNVTAGGTPRAGHEQNMKILAVDDDRGVLELLPLVLARSGYEDISVANSAEFALEKLQGASPKFECIFLDIQMPFMDGIELCARIRALAAYRHTPIIMLTAMSEKEYVTRAFAAGATDYATKPFDVLELGARARVAEELNLARRGAVDAPSSSRPPVTEEDSFGPTADAALFVDDLKDFVAFPTLVHYLAHLSRSALECSQVMAIRLDAAKEIYARSETSEYLGALRDVADAAAYVLERYNCLIAYAGNGRFVLVSSHPSLLNQEDLESAIQELLDEKNSTYADGEPMDIEVSVGSPVRPELATSNSAARTIEQAILRAERRVAKKQGGDVRLNIARSAV
jgi:CheY-like chemotaxis protein